MREFTKDNLKVKIFDTRPEMGAYAAEEAKAAIKEALSKKAEIRMIFAAAHFVFVLPCISNLRTVLFSTL